MSNRVSSGMRSEASATRLPRFDTGFERGLPDFAMVASRTSLPADPLAEARRIGYDQGFAEASAALAGEADAARQSAGQHAAEAHAAARAQWCSLEAERFAALLDEGMGAIEARLSAHLAVLLTPFLAGALRERALQAFADAVRTALGHGGRPEKPPTAIEISGPADYLDALRGKLGSEYAAIVYLSGPGPEVKAHIDETRLSTNLTDWLGILAPEPAP